MDEMQKLSITICVITLNLARHVFFAINCTVTNYTRQVNKLILNVF